MSISIEKIERESFRGKKPAVVIATLSCTYEQLIKMLRHSRSKNSKYQVNIHMHNGSSYETKCSIAIVHPINAPAMISFLDTGKEIVVGDLAEFL